MYSSSLATSRSSAFGARPSSGQVKPSSGTRRFICVNAAHAVPLPTVKEDEASNFGYDKMKAFTSGLGFVVGDVLAQGITGTANIDALRSVQLGAIGAGLDIFRQDVAKNSGGRGEKIAKVAQTVSSQAVWAPMVACAFYAALKVAEGNPGDIVQGLEDKVTALMVGNYLLWPLTRFLNDKFVPAEHRVTANHIITVVWNAWLSTLGHAPAIDASDLLDKVPGADNAISSMAQHVTPHINGLSTAFCQAASPFVHSAGQGLTAIAEKMPSCLLEKAFSKSLDVISPWASVERSPSQLLEAAGSISLERAGTLELVLDRLHSTHL